MNEDLLKKFKNVEMPKILEETTPFINPEKLEDWKTILVSNSDNGFKIAMLRLIAELITLLGKGETCEKACDLIAAKYALTVWHVATAVDFASRVSIRGEELMRWWNNRWEVPDRVTVVNPSVLELKKKKDE
jgi:hypothetical protein